MFGETNIFYVMIWNHPIETSIYEWLFGVPGCYRGNGTLNIFFTIDLPPCILRSQNRRKKQDCIISSLGFSFTFQWKPDSGWWLNHPSEKYARQNGFIFPNVRGENKKYLSCHHLEIVLLILPFFKFLRSNMSTRIRIAIQKQPRSC